MIALSLETLVQQKTNEEDLICLFLEQRLSPHLPLIISTVGCG